MFGNGRNHLKESRTRHKDDLSIDIVIKGHRMLEELMCCLTPEQKIKFECYINSNYELSKSLTLKSLKENPVPLIRYAILTDDLKMLATVMFWSSFFQDNDSDLIKGRRDTRLTNFDHIAKFGMTLKDFVSNYKIDNPRMNLTRVKNRLPELLNGEKSLLVCNAPGYDSIEQFSYDTPSRLVIVPNFPISYFMAKSTGVELVPLVGLCSKEYKVELFLNKKRPFFLE